MTFSFFGHMLTEPASISMGFEALPRGERAVGYGNDCVVLNKGFTPQVWQDLMLFFQDWSPGEVGS
jgi:hypothetical protein